jgi:hypothetical protein
MTQTSQITAPQQPMTLLPSDLKPTTTSPNDNTTTCPQPHEQLLVGWTAGGTRGWTTDNEEQLTGGRGMGMDRRTTTNNNDNEQRMTTTGMMTTNRDSDNKQQTMMTGTTTMIDRAPTPTLMSNCSSGGLRVHQGCTTTMMTNDQGDNKQ